MELTVGMFQLNLCIKIQKIIIFAYYMPQNIMLLQKVFFLGRREEYSPNSIQISKEKFDEHLNILIDNQKDNTGTRFDNIYFPDNFNNSFDSYDFPLKIFSFYSCHNLGSFSNSRLRSIRVNNCKLNGIRAHNIKVEEITITGSTVSSNSIIRDSNIDTMSVHNTDFECSFRIKNIKEYQNNIYKCSIYFNEVNFKKDVEIGNIEFLDENSELRIVNSTFDKNMYYHDNRLNDFLNFEYCKFNDGKAYLENIDASKVKLSSINLEYIQFSNCIFPEKYEYIEKESEVKAEAVYRELKKIAFDQKDYNLVSKWHYLEKEMLLKNLKKQKNYLIYFFLYIYRALSGYGEKPSKAIRSLAIYISLVVLMLIVIGVSHTGISSGVDWRVARSLLYSLRDFIPFFITPSKESLLIHIEYNWLLLIIYNLTAAIGRIYCVVQIALLTFSIRNQMKR